jgi:hypothetical protein
MTIIERVEMTSGRVRTVERAWKRDRNGSVSQTIHIDGMKMQRREGDAEIAGMFAGLDEAWEPAALFSLPPAKMRDRVLRIVPRSGDMSLDRIVPGDCPAWALPKHGDLLPVDWAAFALAQADERIRTHLFNASAVGAMGDLPFGEAWPEVWIADERDLSRAREVVAAHAARQSSGGSVCCSGCGEESPSNFGCCWNCGMDVGAGAQPASAAGCVR